MLSVDQLIAMSFCTEPENFIIILPVIKSSVILGHLRSEKKAKLHLSLNIFYFIIIMSYLVYKSTKIKKLTIVLSEARISFFFLVSSNAVFYITIF